MNDVTRLLSNLQAGDRAASEHLLPLVYEELRRLAAQRMASENAAITLQPTALVHEAYLRLVDQDDLAWDGRSHFFAAAAEAMRRILVEAARSRKSQKRGGDRQRFDLLEDDLVTFPISDELLDLNQALMSLQDHDPQATVGGPATHVLGNDHRRSCSASRGFGQHRKTKLVVRSCLVGPRNSLRIGRK